MADTGDTGILQPTRRARQRPPNLNGQATQGQHAQAERMHSEECSRASSEQQTTHQDRVFVHPWVSRHLCGVRRGPCCAAKGLGRRRRSEQLDDSGNLDIFLAVYLGCVSKTLRGRSAVNCFMWMARGLHQTTQGRKGSARYKERREESVLWEGWVAMPYQDTSCWLPALKTGTNITSSLTLWTSELGNYDRRSRKIRNRGKMTTVM